MKKHFVSFFLLTILVVSSSSSCTGFNQDDLLQTGVAQFKNPNSAIRQHCYQLDINYNVPQSGYQVAVSTSQFNLKTPRTGIDYSIRAGKKNDKQKLDISLLITDSTKWTSIKVSYLITSRNDFRVGSYIADTFQVIDCSPNNDKQFETSTQVDNWVPTGQKTKVLAFISGIRIQDYSFSTKIQNSLINNLNGVLKVQIYSDAYPNLEILHINYIIYQQTAPFLFGNYAPQNSDYFFSGVSQALVSTTFGTVQYSLSILSKKLECQGSRCPSGCIDQNQCKVLGGIENNRICFVCGFGQSYKEGKCQTNCGNYELFYNGKCICQNGYTYFGGKCVKIPVCGGKQTLDTVNNVCVCKQGFAKINNDCVKIPNCKGYQKLDVATNTCVCIVGYVKIYGNCVQVPDCGNNQILDVQNNVCICKAGYRKIGSNCFLIPECLGYQKLDEASNICVCIAGYTRINNVCVKPPLQCGINEVEQNRVCICKPGYIMVGPICTNQCGINEVYSYGKCICKDGYAKITGVCRQCPVNAEPSQAGDACVCKLGFQETNGQCVQAPKCPQNAAFHYDACKCNDGYYFSENKCILSPTCPANSAWNQNKLVCQCIQQSYYLINGVCQPCRQNEGWNGQKCVCKTGFFNIQGQCRSCASNTFYNGQDCYCNPGYFGNRDGCFKCHYSCSQCTGSNENQCTSCVDVSYSFDKGYCIRKTPCPTGFYFNQQACQPCSQYCSQCDSANTCKKCIDGFQAQTLTVGGSDISLCVQICGDGKRFQDQCDDNNKIDGDGCSSTCKTEKGWTCAGGSSIRRDFCTELTPSRYILEKKNAVLLFGRVVHGMRISDIPEKLKELDCAECSKLLWVKVIKSNIVPGVRVEYIPKSKYQYLVEFDFHGTIAIPVFTFTVQINPKYAQYFSKEDLDQVVIVNVDPALLAKVDQTPTLSFDFLGGNANSAKINIPDQAKGKIFGN